jgi:hypothetical protein
MSALDEAEAQVRAVRHKCPLASAEALERGRMVIYRIGVARNNGRGYAQAIADAAQIIATLEREHRDRSRSTRRTQRELFPEREQ